MNIQDKNVPDRGNSKCKDLGAEACPMWLRNSTESTMCKDDLTNDNQMRPDEEEMQI